MAASSSPPLASTPTEVIDRHFFRSVYFTEPGGVLFEIAERGGPGFIVDEPDAEHMGDELTAAAVARGAAQAVRMVADSPVPTTAEIRPAQAPAARRVPHAGARRGACDRCPPRRREPL